MATLPAGLAGAAEQRAIGRVKHTYGGVFPPTTGQCHIHVA